MTDVKRLLDEATPLPWKRDATQEDEPVVYVSRKTEGDGIDYAHVLFQSDWGTEADAALIVYAVNSLPDYEAAVDALERLVEGQWDTAASSGSPLADARAALRRLRGDA